MNREPVLASGTIVAGVVALVALIVVGVLSWHGDARTAALVVTGILAPIAAALMARPKVTPVEPVRRRRGEVGESAVLIAILIGVLFLVVLALAPLLR